MYRFIKLIMPFGLLIVMLNWLNWFDVFHLTVAFFVVCTMFLLGMLVHRWKRGNPSEEDIDEISGGTPSPNLFRGLLVGTLYSLLFNGMVFGGVRVFQATPLYSLWSDCDLQAVEDRVQILDEAGSYEEAARFASERLARPVSPQARERLAGRLVNSLIQAGKARWDNGELDLAHQLLSRAVAVAEEYGLDSDLPSVLVNEIQKTVCFQKRLEILEQSGKWIELLRAVEEYMVTNGGKPSPWLISLNIKSLIRQGTDPNCPLNERIGYLQNATEVAVKFRTDPSEARRELDRLKEQKHFADQIEQLCWTNRFDQAADLLRLAIARSPRKQWMMPLDRRLYDIILLNAHNINDPAMQKNKYREALEVAKEFGLDGSVAVQAVKALDTQELLANSKTQLANAEKNAQEQQQKAEASRKDADDARRMLAEMLKQASPCELSPGAKANFTHIDIQNHPVVLVDLWVARADDSPYLGLAQKDFHATFCGFPATVALAPIPVQSHKRGLRVMLVIDASGSMGGRAIEEAKKGATLFINTLPTEAQVGIVRFASTIQIECEFSQNRSQLCQAIERINASGNTALYKAINSSAQRLASPTPSPTWPEEARFIVLLSDGRDTDGGIPINEVLANCRNAKARVYAIGLKSADLDSALLRKLTTETNGAYLEADNVDQLASQFRIASVEVQRERYRLAVSVPAENNRGRLSIMIGSGPNSVTISEDIEVQPVR